MRFRHVLSLTCATVLAGACGNISNEDLEFAAILPDQDLMVALPPSANMNALVPPASSVSFDAAVTTAAEMNRLTQGVSRRLRQVVTRPAAVRRAGHREWGPFSVTGFPGFLRLIMDVDRSVTCELEAPRVGSEARGYSWRLEVGPARTGTFATLAAGRVRGSDFTTSCGSIDYSATVSRAVGGEETDSDPRATHVAWSRSPDSSAMEVSFAAAPLVEAPFVEGQTYAFGEDAAGGYFSFRRRYLPANRPGVLYVLRAELDWGPMGRPWRSEFHVENAAGDVISHGMTCGDDFGQPTFDRHDLPPDHVIKPDDESCEYDYPHRDPNRR